MRAAPQAPEDRSEAIGSRMRAQDVTGAVPGSSTDSGTKNKPQEGPGTHKSLGQLLVLADRSAPLGGIQGLPRLAPGHISYLTLLTPNSTPASSWPAKPINKPTLMSHSLPSSPPSSTKASTQIPPPPGSPPCSPTLPSWARCLPWALTTALLPHYRSPSFALYFLCWVLSALPALPGRGPHTEEAPRDLC